MKKENEYLLPIFPPIPPEWIQELLDKYLATLANVSIDMPFKFEDEDE